MPTQPTTPENVASAARIIRDGGLVAFPTETVYGLGADATNGRAVAAIYAAKGRPSFNPLIVHVPDATAAWRYGVPTPLAEKLAAAFWPGPLTLVLPLRADAGIADLAVAGLSTIALRVPSHPIALALLRAADRPIAAPSANKSGHVSPTRAEHVAVDFGDAAPMILDGGMTQVGLESTIIDARGTSPVLLRPGGITRDAIARATGSALPDMPPHESHARPTAPGQLASHYAPRATLRLDVTAARPGEALIGFGPGPGLSYHAARSVAGSFCNLSHDGDLAEAAAMLFAALRGADAFGSPTIAVEPIPHPGLGEAINDRLQRAAAPRQA